MKTPYRLSYESKPTPAWLIAAEQKRIERVTRMHDRREAAKRINEQAQELARGLR